MKIHVRAPATTANIGPGFDCVAAALDLWNELEVEEGDDELDESHLGVQAFSRLAPVAGKRFEFTSRVPRERGLGSSAAVIALGLVAGALAAGQEPDPEQLLAIGVELEGHADNLAAALAGGVCLTWENRIVRVADSLPAVPFALVPEATVSTAEARNSLPDSVPFEDAAFTAGRAALLGAALAQGSAELFAEAIQDRLHEPYRAENAPLLERVRSDLPDGALGATLSGSGTSVIVWVRTERGRLLRGGARPPLRGRECASLHSLRARSPPGMSDPDKRKSAALTDGPERAAARAMLKGIGFTDDDLARPIIGVATTWIETMPCNWNQRELAQHVKRGIRAAGGTPMEFNTVAVSDGVSMGTEGMRASLVSREVIADSIELVARGHLFDGLVCLVGCDKTIPAAVMALARLDLPGLALYNGSIAPGRFRGRDVTIQDVFEAVGAHAVGKMSDEDLHELEGVACPGAGACGGQFTANTMSTALDFLGISPAGLNGIPALHPSKAEAAEAAGRLAMDLLRRDLRPSQIITRDALENAAASIVATGGSTNGVLHLLAIARELGVPFELDDFDRIAAETPIVASLKPGGQYVATDVYEAGGVALVARELLKKELVHADSPNVDGRSLGEIAAAVEEKPGQEVVVPIETPIKPIGGLARPAREPRARGLRGQARRARTALPSRRGARLRLGRGVFRRSEGRGD